jgi:hypothetical protein
MGTRMVNGLLAYAAGAMVLLHVLRPDYAPSHRFLSEYALGAYGLVMTSVFLTLGLATLVLTARIRVTRSSGIAVVTGACALVLRPKSYDRDVV